ncbi:MULTISPECIES: hypothetical protein [unclassified Streptomyces]|uniref:hypothetical protein n=1 Tax=unclassified Streptomyces TaxID=2593676 RepID=UPI001162C375|nr:MULTISPECIES: hypothetical protein [unclassified Streptomyces]NMI59028.1 hypothetical protein [Streptomyces sp. RLA2-12]QDN58310.1 hypothetical protein FNV67_25985 [Streptomyces sp. S1D4-20]QDN68404.1 hypothetical protein FNV66_25175 [Streptomyces sp. S1D4-14]QDO50823.1 hypothetical protein FNV60_23440 [Streptomyces sp. RLB3-5]QDO61061.1 hypothetical protein FNV59_25680 [Streptomyces sp. RLB1-8]
MGRVTVTASALRRGPCHADRHEQTSTSRVSVGVRTYAEPLYGRLSARSLVPVCDLVPVPVPVPVLVSVSVSVSGDGCGP